MQDQDGQNNNISVRIKIGITFNFRLHRHPIPLVVLVPVGLLSIFWHLRQVLFIVKVSSVAKPGQLTVGVQINKTCLRCQKIDERPTGTNTTNWVGQRWSLKLKISTFLNSNSNTLHKNGKEFQRFHYWCQLLLLAMC